MSTYTVSITGLYHVQTLVEANSSREAEQQVSEWGIEKIEELIVDQGCSLRDVLSIASDAFPVSKKGYIVQANGDQFHRFFSSEYDLLQHLDQRQKELYFGAVEYKDLFNFFYARNYVRVV
jgi:hypothetical protein